MRMVRSFLTRTLPAPVLVRLRALDLRAHAGEELRLLPRLCDRRKCSIDVGANLGVLTYVLTRHSSHVFAYEPNPELAARLRKTFGRRVTVVQAAASDRSGTTVLKVPRYRRIEMHGLASVAQDFDDADEVREFEVPIRRLDDEGFENVGFVKIDVEQHEQEVLRGAARLLRDEKPNVLLEVTPKLYSKHLQEFISDTVGSEYHGHFLFGGGLWPLADYRPDVHNRSENYGKSGEYVTNVVLTTRPLG